MTKETEGLLCVANFPANTGYAWDFIESLFARASDFLALRGIETWVAYPEIATAPKTLASSAAKFVQLDTSLNSVSSVLEFVKFVRRGNVRVLYLTDRPVRSFVYALLRLAGVRRIVVHDHT